jgi:hypothetical protein
MLFPSLTLPALTDEGDTLTGLVQEGRRWKRQIRLCSPPEAGQEPRLAWRRRRLLLRSSALVQVLVEIDEGLAYLPISASGNSPPEVSTQGSLDDKIPDFQPDWRAEEFGVVELFPESWMDGGSGDMNAEPDASQAALPLDTSTDP